jgi:hypothetical protein
LGTEFFYEAFVVYFALNFPRGDYHIVVVFFSVRCSRFVSPVLLMRNGVLSYMLFSVKKRCKKPKRIGQKRQ